MKLSKAMQIRINNLLREHNLSRYSLSIQAGISPSVLTDFYSGKTTYLRIDSILHICEGFDIDLEEFFADDIFKNVDAEK